jgi:hypothetical protein
LRAGGQARFPRIRVLAGLKHSPVHRPKEGEKTVLRKSTLLSLVVDPGARLFHFNHLLIFLQVDWGRKKESDFVIELGIGSRFPSGIFVRYYY